MFSKLFKKAEKPTNPAEVYNGLRNQILNLKPSDAGIEPSKEMPNVWGILMETGYPQAVSHVLAFFWLDGFAVPAPAQVTHAVGRLQTNQCYEIKQYKRANNERNTN